MGPNNPKGQYSLDLNCILGWTYNDTVIYNKIRNLLQSYGWTNPNASDSFRKITDESWCIALLGENNENKKTITYLSDMKEKEFLDYLKSDDSLDRKVIAGDHILLMFDRLKDYGYDISNYTSFISYVKSFIINEIENGKLLFPQDVYHLTAYTISKTGTQDKLFLESLIEKILRNQNFDGSWNIDVSNSFRVYSTLRNIIALDMFRVNYPS
jgi:hypothetical protein